MADIINNKQVNIWRGADPPPTIYHIWINQQRQLCLYDGEKWVAFLDNPGLSLSYQGDKVKVENGDTYFTIEASGGGLAVRAQNNSVIFTSTALTTIDIEGDSLEYKGGKLSHLESGVQAGTYGPSADVTGTSSFTVPAITVNKEGHVVAASNYGVTVPDRVAQNPMSVNAAGVFPIIVAGSTDPGVVVGAVNKDQDLALKIEQSGGKTTKTFYTPGIQAAGGITVAGDIIVPAGYVIRGEVWGNVTGTATPTDHADPTAKYGAGTSAGPGGTDAQYGHVKLQDTLPTEEPPKGYTEAGQGIAATPNMVFEAVKVTKAYADDLFGIDFRKDSSSHKYNINWTEL